MTQIALPIYALLISIPCLIALGQVLFKKTSDRLVTSDGHLLSVVFDPLFILALAIYGGSTLLWIYALKTVPLAYAYSFMALTFVIVPVLAVLWLGEPITVKYAIGGALIVTGLILTQI